MGPPTYPCLRTESVVTACYPHFLPMQGRNYTGISGPKGFLQKCQNIQIIHRAIYTHTSHWYRKNFWNMKVLKWILKMNRFLQAKRKNIWKKKNHVILMFNDLRMGLWPAKARASENVGWGLAMPINHCDLACHLCLSPYFCTHLLGTTLILTELHHRVHMIEGSRSVCKK